MLQVLGHIFRKWTHYAFKASSHFIIGWVRYGQTRGWDIVRTTTQWPHRTTTTCLTKQPIEAHDYQDKKRQPSVGLVPPENDRDSATLKTLTGPAATVDWKMEHTFFEMPTVPLQVHECINPYTIQTARKQWLCAVQPRQSQSHQKPRICSLQARLRPALRRRFSMPQ